jgi:hypothetical protein
MKNVFLLKGDRIVADRAIITFEEGKRVYSFENFIPHSTFHETGLEDMGVIVFESFEECVEYINEKIDEHTRAAEALKVAKQQADFTKMFSWNGAVAEYFIPKYNPSRPGCADRPPTAKNVIKLKSDGDHFAIEDLLDLTLVALRESVASRDESDYDSKLDLAVRMLEEARENIKL